MHCTQCRPQHIEAINDVAGCNLTTGSSDAWLWQLALATVGASNIVVLSVSTSFRTKNIQILNQIPKNPMLPS